MQLITKLYKLGDFFFKYRSFLPVILVIFFIIEAPYFYYPQSSIRGEIYLELGCLFVSLIGFAIRVIAIGFSQPGTSGRTKVQKTSALNNDGIYSVVRNPLYLGNFFIILGISFLLQDWRLVIINVLLFICFYFPIILREEQFLKEAFPDAFREYAARTPVIIPNIKKWKAPARRFSLPRVLRREHDGLLAIIFTFFIIATLRESVVMRRVCINHLWTHILIVTFILWLILKLSKKNLKNMEKA